MLMTAVAAIRHKFFARNSVIVSKNVGKNSAYRLAMRRWLRIVRALHGLEQEDLVPYTGRTRTTISMYESGDRNVPTEVINRLVAAFPDAPPPPSAYEDGDPSETAAVRETVRVYELPYEGVLPSSGASQPEPEMKPIDARFTGEDRFIRRIAGLSAYPALREGDVAVWKRDPEPNYGVIVLAQRESDRAQVARLYAFDDQRQEAVCLPLNPETPATPEGEAWKPIARLIGLIRQSDGPERTWLWEPGLRPEHILQPD